MTKLQSSYNIFFGSALFFIEILIKKSSFAFGQLYTTCASDGQKHLSVILDRTEMIDLIISIASLIFLVGSIINFRNKSSKLLWVIELIVWLFVLIISRAVI